MDFKFTSSLNTLADTLLTLLAGNTKVSSVEIMLNALVMSLIFVLDRSTSVKAVYWNAEVPMDVRDVNLVSREHSLQASVKPLSQVLKTDILN